jgi:hypothetical protein
MTKIYKEISYSYPTSPNAEALGFKKTGCWHVSQTLVDIEGSGQCKTILPHDAEGFDTRNDPDLLAVFKEYDGSENIEWIKV